LLTVNFNFNTRPSYVRPQATCTEIREVRLCGFRVMRVDRQTDKQTDKHTHHNTLHPSGGRTKHNYGHQWWCRQGSLFEDEARHEVEISRLQQGGNLRLL